MRPSCAQARLSTPAFQVRVTTAFNLKLNRVDVTRLHFRVYFNPNLAGNACLHCNLWHCGPLALALAAGQLDRHV